MKRIWQWITRRPRPRPPSGRYTAKGLPAAFSEAELDELARIRRADEQATPGPWEADGPWFGPEPRGVGLVAAAYHDAQGLRDVELIVLARNVLPQLIELVEAARDVTAEDWFRIRSEGQAHALLMALAPFVEER